MTLFVVTGVFIGWNCERPFALSKKIVLMIVTNIVSRLTLICFHLLSLFSVSFPTTVLNNPIMLQKNKLNC